MLSIFIRLDTHFEYHFVTIKKKKQHWPYVTCKKIEILVYLIEIVYKLRGNLWECSLEYNIL